MKTQNWVRRLALLGAVLFGAGTAWILVLLYSIRGYPEGIRYEMRMPWPPRLMVFVGFALLVIAVCGIATGYLRSRN